MYLSTVSLPHISQAAPANTLTHFSPLLVDLQLQETTTKLVAGATPTSPTLSMAAPVAPTLLLASNTLLLDAGQVVSDQPLLVAANNSFQLPAINTSSDEAITSPQIGQVSMLVNGPVVAQNGDFVRPLYEGAPIHLNDTIMTGAGSYVKITLQDGTVFQLGPLSRATLEMFVLHQDSPHSSSELQASVNAGLFRFVREGDNDDDDNYHATIYTPSATLTLYSSEIDGWIDQEGSTTLLHTAGFVDVATLNQNSSLTPAQIGSILYIPVNQTVIQTAQQVEPSDVTAFRQQLAPLNPDASEAVAEVAELAHNTMQAPTPVPVTPVSTEEQPAATPIFSTSVTRNVETPVTTTAAANETRVQTPTATQTNTSELTQSTTQTTNAALDGSTTDNIALLDIDTDLLNQGSFRRGVNPNESSENTNDSNTELSNIDTTVNSTATTSTDETDQNAAQIILTVNQPLMIPVEDISQFIGVDESAIHLEVGNGEHGEALIENGILYFIPEANFTGTANFEYEINISGYTTRATITIDVEPSQSTEAQHNPVQAAPQPNTPALDTDTGTDEFAVPVVPETELDKADSVQSEQTSTLNLPIQQNSENTNTTQTAANATGDTTEQDETMSHPEQPIQSDIENADAVNQDTQTTESSAENPANNLDPLDATAQMDLTEQPFALETNANTETTTEVSNATDTQTETQPLETSSTSLVLQDVLPSAADEHSVLVENPFATYEPQQNLDFASTYANPISSDTLLTPAPHLDLLS